MKKESNQNEAPEILLFPEEIEIHELLNNELKMTIINMLNELRNMMHEQNENFSKKTENIKRTKMKCWAGRLK